MTKQIHVRPACPNDYELVLAIGPDFKAAVHPVTIMYHSYFSDPQAHPFVTEIDGEVVRLLFYSTFCLNCQFLLQICCPVLKENMVYNNTIPVGIKGVVLKNIVCKCNAFVMTFVKTNLCRSYEEFDEFPCSDLITFSYIWL